MQEAASSIKYGTLYSPTNRRPFICVYIELNIRSRDGGTVTDVARYYLYDSTYVFGGGGLRLLKDGTGIWGHDPVQGIRYNEAPVLSGVWKSYEYGWIVGPGTPHEPYFSTNDATTDYYKIDVFPGFSDSGGERTYGNLVGSGTTTLSVVGSEYGHVPPSSQSGSVFQGVDSNLSGVYTPYAGSDDSDPVVLGNVVLAPESVTGACSILGVGRFKIAAPVGVKGSSGGFLACEYSGSMFLERSKYQRDGGYLLDEIQLQGFDRLKLVKDDDNGDWIDTTVAKVVGSDAFAKFKLVENRLTLEIEAASGVDPFLPAGTEGDYFASVLDSLPSSEYGSFDSLYTVFKKGGCTLQPAFSGAARYELTQNDAVIAYTVEAPNRETQVKLYKQGTEPGDGVYELVSRIDDDRGGGGWFSDPVFMDVDNSKAVFEMSGITDWTDGLGIAHVALGALWRGKGKGL